MDKKKIAKEILSQSYNVTDQAGEELQVVDVKDVFDIVSRIVDSVSNRFINDSDLDTIKELRDLMEEVINGNYKPDSFTNQPINNLIERLYCCGALNILMKMRKAKIIDLKIEERIQLGYCSDVTFSYYNEQQFTPVTARIKVEQCYDFDSCVKDTKKQVREFVADNRAKDFAKQRKKAGWL